MDRLRDRQKEGFLLQMPILGVEVLACMLASPWPMRLALIVGFVPLGIDAALLFVEMRSPGNVT
jgi:hypothetical protein